MEYDLLVVGLNHRTAPVELREQLAFDGEVLEQGNHEVAALDDVDEGAIVSTCNRVEVVACAHDGDAAQDRVTGFLESRSPVTGGELLSHLYVHRGRNAVRHLFRVASSLDSMVVGEPQILGQLKDAYTRASGTGATGPVLHRCFHKAFSVAKRVRTETGVAGRAVSVSSAAVELASKIFDRLEDKTTMLIGAGTMGELTARHMLSHGVGNMIVSNRTFDRAVELAREFKATPVPFDDFPRYLRMADIVIGSTGATDYILKAGAVHEALRERQNRPIFCIDLSVPRNFDPEINRLPNAYLYDVDDLAGIAQENLGERAREADKAETIIADEVEIFWRWLGQLDVVPTIVALRNKAEEIRNAELNKALRVLGKLSPKERKAIEMMSAAIVNKLLHSPLRCLKQQDHREETFYVDVTRRLFGIEDPDRN